jgi:hypothetical protein
MDRVVRTLDYRLAGMEQTNKALAAVLSPWFVLSSYRDDRVVSACGGAYRPIGITM